ncbi:MAG: hypothetical protein JWR42_2515, partial [Marmoricola sp.]|nr:hypothetical protein [Marmoricola sp.]
LALARRVDLGAVGVAAAAAIAVGAVRGPA